MIDEEERVRTFLVWCDGSDSVIGYLFVDNIRCHYSPNPRAGLGLPYFGEPGTSFIVTTITTIKVPGGNRRGPPGTGW